MDASRKPCRGCGRYEGAQVYAVQFAQFSALGRYRVSLCDTCKRKVESGRLVRLGWPFLEFVETDGDDEVAISDV